MSHPVPFVSGVMKIEKDWIDYNGHLNMAYYTVLFDRGSDEAFALLGMGPAYAQERRFTTYTAEIHMRYIRELHLGDSVRVSFHLLEHDARRLRFWQEIRQHPEGWLASTMENITLHIDMSGPKVAPFPPDILANVEKMRAAHSAFPVPEDVGRVIALNRKRS